MNYTLSPDESIFFNEHPQLQSVHINRLPEATTQYTARSSAQNITVHSTSKFTAPDRYNDVRQGQIHWSLVRPYFHPQQSYIYIYMIQTAIQDGLF